MTPDEIFAHVRATIAELFELEPEEIEPESKIFQDLDLDSIDAIDLVAKLQQFTGQRIDEDTMRGVRTVNDLVRILAKQLEQPSGAAAGQ
jgi:acyl carrier protein